MEEHREKDSAEQTEAQESEYQEPEHPEFEDLNHPARAGLDPNRRPDGTFIKGHKYQWKPGQSGNPNGRPPNGEQRPGKPPEITRITDLMRHMSSKPCTVKGYKNMTWAQAVAKAMFEYVVGKGNSRLAKELLDRLDGTVKQIHEVETTGRTILEFVVAEPPDKAQHEENMANGKLNGTTKAGDSHNEGS